MDRPSRRRSAFRVTISILMLALVLVALVAYAIDDSDQRSAAVATVQITAVTSGPDFRAPWQSRPTSTVGGSGVLLEGGRVLTNAHVVNGAVSIELKRVGLPGSYPAHIEFIDHGSDLALLAVDKPGFGGAGVEMMLGEIPAPHAAVDVYGYPENAQTVCRTEAVVSRVEFGSCAHSWQLVLFGSLDKLLKPGNSGGPVVADGKVIGLATQNLNQDIAGQFITVPAIRQFLADVADGHVDGRPEFGLRFQTLESDALRASCGMSPTQTGVLVCAVGVGGSGDGVMRVGDVIMAVAGIPVANDGTMALDKERRVDFSWPLETRQVGDRLDVGILRDGVVRHETIVLGSDGLLVDGPHFPDRAPYRIFGGLVFQPVDLDLVITNRDNLGANVLLPADSCALATAARRQRVTLGRVLPHEVNRGYQDWGTELVESVNGEPVRDFAHFNELLDGAGDRWITILMDDASSVVLDLAAARAALPVILGTYNIGDERFPAAPRAPVAVKVAGPGTRAS